MSVEQFKLSNLFMSSLQWIDSQKFLTPRGAAIASGIFELFGQFSGKSGNEVCEDLLVWISENKTGPNLCQNRTRPQRLQPKLLDDKDVMHSNPSRRHCNLLSRPNVQKTHNHTHVKISVEYPVLTVQNECQRDHGLQQN